jgi:hypothetical protein
MLNLRPEPAFNIGMLNAGSDPVFNMDVVFATCDQQPLIAADDQPLAEALAARGVGVTPIPWTEIDPYSVHDAPPILLRSTWDYHRKPAMFTSWLAALDDSGRTTWNAPQIARGNVDKIYLKISKPQASRSRRLDGSIARTTYRSPRSCAKRTGSERC